MNPFPKRIQTTRTTLLLTAILLGAFALRVAYLARDRFHADEALYAGWALLIHDRDPLLVSVPVDKPPLYLYTLAGSLGAFGSSETAARLPNLAASMLGIALVYRCGRRLYDRATGIWAALFVALSPFDILFARTAFTDPMLNLWLLCALYAISTDRWFGAGIGLGLAFATKQHAVLAIPLIVAVGLVCKGKRLASPPVRRYGHAPSGMEMLKENAKRLLGGVLGFAIPFALVVAWDAARWEVRPGYWRQSAMSYGGLSWAEFTQWGERFVEWLSWARYLTGSPVLSVLLLSGCVVLLVRGWGHIHVAGANEVGVHGGDAPTRVHTWLDTSFVAYAIGYLGVHTIFRFSIWDRYLMPLTPIVGLLLARIVVQLNVQQPWQRAPSFPIVGRYYWKNPNLSLRGALFATKHRHEYSWWQSPAQPWRLLRANYALAMTIFQRYPGQIGNLHKARWHLALRALCASVVLLIALLSGWKAAHNGYPVGGEHWAYQGLDQVVAYLKQNAPPDAVLYHHWLRWHYSFYLHDTDFELRWWQSGEHLRREAERTPQQAQYIVLPEWRILEPDLGTQAANGGIHFEPVYETRREDGSVSMRVYRIELRQAREPPSAPS